MRVRGGLVAGIAIVISTGSMSAGAQAAPRNDVGATTADPIYQIEPLTVLLKSGELVGSKRSGSFCLPAGRIGWREAKPDTDDVASAIVSRLSAAGLRVQRRGDGGEAGASAPTVAISAELLDVKLSACVPPGGLGRLLNRSSTVKGEGSVAVRWTIRDMAKREPIRTWQSCPTFKYHESNGAVPAMIVVGIANAADDLAIYLKRERPDRSHSPDQEDLSASCLAPKS